MPYFEYPDTNNRTVIDFMQYNNNAAEGGFGMIMLLSIFAVSFFSLKTYTSERAFGASMFITTMASYFLVILGMVSIGIAVTATIITAFTIFFLNRWDT